MTLPTLAAATGQSVEDYLDLPLEDLLNLEVSSVAKKPQRLAETAAAVHVITQEDIRRSGVTSIPEALRMAPGVQVARIGSNQWAVSIRGFNGRFTNKLLVLMDGRTLYSPAISGVFWEAQDTLLEDIERIEVIRGPGGAVWGANAVNGIVNVITKHASETQGGLVSLGAGDHEQGFAGLRYGGQLAEGTYGRLYVKGFERDHYALLADGSDANDDWRSYQGGFRIDSEASERDNWTLQGDVYHSDANEFDAVLTLPRATAADSAGWNLLARWERQLAAGSSATFQSYYDHTERTDSLIDQTHDTVDVDFFHRVGLGQWHDLQWGLGYRHISDSFDSRPPLTVFNPVPPAGFFAEPRLILDPDSDSFDLFSAFIQDEVTLVPERLFLTLGSKFEHNDFTGFEIQPSARLLWIPAEGQTLWGAVSRAVRTPSRVEDSGSIAVPPVGGVSSIEGDSDFDSEQVVAYELGYRIQLAKPLAFDIAAFYNDYDQLQSIEPTLPPSPTSLPIPASVRFGLPYQAFDNNLEGESLGVELAVDWRPLNWWRIQAHYTYLKLSLHASSGSLDPTSEPVGEGSAPQNQFSLRSSMDLGRKWQLDLWSYYVDNLPSPSPPAIFGAQGIDSYLSLNTRLAWRPQADVELSLVGQNLLDDRHAEFVAETFLPATEIERSVYGQVRWEF